MQNTPAPCPPALPFTIDAPNGPPLKKFQSYNEVIPRAGHFTEYPTVKDFPYDNQRKGVGYAKIRTPKGKLGEKVVQPGCVPPLPMSVRSSKVFSTIQFQRMARKQAAISFPLRTYTDHERLADLALKGVH
jgi:hypothetical protein